MESIRKRGFTLIELLVVIPIALIISYYLFTTIQRVVNRLSIHSSLSSVRIDMLASLTRKKVEFENIMMLSQYGKDDASESFMDITQNDYFGIYGVNSADLYHDRCKYSTTKDSDGNGPYSILRYTYISRLKRFLIMSDDWRDQDGDSDGEIDQLLHLYYYDVTTNPNDEARKLIEVVRPFIFEGLKDDDDTHFVEELLVMNKDKWTKARYFVEEAAFVAEDLVNSIPDHLELKLVRPPLANGSSVQPHLNINFIKGSYVYYAKTKVLCVNHDGVLTTFDDNSERESIVFNPNPHKLRLKKFEISYSGLKEGVELSSTIFKSPFPSNNEERRCIDLIKFDFDVVPDMKGRKEIKDRGIVESRVFFLPNMNLSKNGNCDDIIDLWLN